MRKKKRYWWKCQDCGLSYSKVTADEPRRGCPCCGRKGVKTPIKGIYDSQTPR